MRWQGRRQSTNVDDRRGRAGRRLGFPLGGGRSGRGVPIRLSGGGLAFMAVLFVVFMLMGGDPLSLLQLLAGGSGSGGPGAAVQLDSPQPRTAAEDERARFIAVVLADTEDVWHRLFAEMGREYEEPKLVLFTGATQSGCGFADAAVGPFYCPADRTIYIDLSFFEELSRRFGAPGDFAQAYVLAHEVGHHVQNLLGQTDRVHQARGRVSQSEYNQLSVRLELQADFLAGVWAHHAQQMKNILEAGDIDEALGAASAIGDDRLQKQAQGYVVPDAFTHGSSAQRVRWFRKGFESGRLDDGDTFAADGL